MADYLRGHIDGGDQAVQVFYSWVVALSASDYREFVFPHVKRIFDGLADLDVPTIHFGTGTGHLLSAQREAGGTVIGVDWRTPLDEGWERAGLDVAIQGNLDPTALLGSPETIVQQVRKLVEAGRGGGHVVNLGHGILPETPPEHVAALCEIVHGWDRRG